MVLLTTYPPDMTVKKLSISLDSAVADRAQRAAEREGMSLSAWLSRAAEQSALLADAKGVIDEHFTAYGEPDPQVAQDAQAELDAIGFGLPMSAEQQAARRRTLAWLDGELDEEDQGGAR